MTTELDAATHTIRQIVLLLGGLQVVVVGLIVWLGQLWIGRRLGQERAALETRLANHTHALNGALAHYAARTGLLSEAQLRATESIWSKLFRVQWDVVRRASPLQSVRLAQPGIPNPDALREEYFGQMQAELGKLDAARLELLEAAHERRPFLPKALFDEMDRYNGLLFEAVTLLQEHLEDEENLQPGEDQTAAVERRRAYRVKRDDLVKRLSELHDKIADEIRALTSPPLPSPPK